MKSIEVCSYGTSWSLSAHACGQGGCRCELERIDEVRKRRGPLGWARSVYEALSAKLPDIRPAIRDPGGYELVILGTPVWAGRLSSPMRAYIHEHRDSFRQIAAFCTMGGSGGDKVIDEIATLCGKRPLARIVLTDKEIQRDRHQDKIGLFARGAAAAG